MKRASIFFCLLIALLAMTTSIWADQVTIGTGTYTSYYPLGIAFAYARSAALYTAAELGNVDQQITELAWYANTGRAYGSPVKIYLKPTTDSFQTSDTWANVIDGSTQVYNGIYPSITAGAWNSFTLSSIFNLTAGNNLLILVETNNGTNGMTGANPATPYTNATDMHQTWYNYYYPPTGLGSVYRERPNVLITYNNGWTTDTIPNFAADPNPAHNATNMPINSMLSWSNPGVEATGYHIYLGIDALPGTPTVTQSSNFWYPTLEYEKTYYWKVVPYNGIGECTSGIETWIFSTITDPRIHFEDLPYTQNFDSVTPPDLPYGWSKQRVMSGDLETRALAGPYSFPNVLWMYNWTSRDDMFLISPQITTPLNTLRLKFWASGGTNASPLIIGTVDTNTPGPGYTFTPFQTIILGNGYAYYSIVWDTYTGIDQYIAFKHDATANYQIIKLDDILLEVFPTVPIYNLSPDVSEWDFGQLNLKDTTYQQFTISNSGGGSIDLSPIEVTGDYFTLISQPLDMFLGEGESTSFTVKYNPTAAGSHTGSLIITDNRAVTSIDLSGSCVDATLPSSALPYFENFDGVTAPALPFGWTAKVSGVAWASISTVGSDSYSAPNHIGMHNGTTASLDVLLISPPLETALNTLKVTFWARSSSDSYSLQVGTANLPGEAATFTNVRTIPYLNPYSYSKFTVYYINYTGGDQYIAFRHGLGGTWRPIYIDNITIEVDPHIPEFSYAPTSLDYGQQFPNTPSAWQNITITNMSTGTLNVAAGDISFLGADADQFEFDTTGLPLALGFEQNGYVGVRMVATSAGDKTATLRIVNNQSKANYDVALSGSGIYIAPGTAIIGNGIESACIPIEPYYGYSYSQTIYYPSEINQTNKRLEKISYYWNGAYEATECNQWVIYVGHTTKSVFASSTDWLPISAMTEVFNGIVNIPDVEGWIEIPLSTPFVYNGVDNLVIAVDENENDLWESSNGYFYSTEVDDDRSIVVVDDDYSPDPSDPLALPSPGYYWDMWRDTYIPNTKLQFSLYDIIAGVDTPLNGGTDSGGAVINSSIDLSFDNSVDNDIIVALPNLGNLNSYQTYGLTGIGEANLVFTVGPGTWYGIIYYEGTWHNGVPPELVVTAGNTGVITFPGVQFGAKGDVIVLLGEGADPTLPVELSSFTATLTSDQYVKIAWTAQSETNHSGYNVLRGEANELNNAIKINPTLIDEGENLGTQISYNWTDFEAYNNMVYYYWLESVSLDGVSQFYGPLSVTIGDPTQEPTPPANPLVTKLLNAYPNPFNPSTNIRYSLNEAGKVNIDIYNIKGQLVRSYKNEHGSPGYFQIIWDGRDANGKSAASGIYMYRMTSDNYRSSKKMILAK